MYTLGRYILKWLSLGKFSASFYIHWVLKSRPRISAFMGLMLQRGGEPRTDKTTRQQGVAAAGERRGAGHTCVELGCPTEKPLKYRSDFDQ